MANSVVPKWERFCLSVLATCMVSAIPIWNGLSKAPAEGAEPFSIGMVIALVVAAIISVWIVTSHEASHRLDVVFTAMGLPGFLVSAAVSGQILIN